MYRISFTRMLIAQSDTAEWEDAVREQVQRVSSEPGTILYGFTRRSAEGSTMLPAPREGFSEYLHFQCYLNEEAFNTHVANEKAWWSPINARLVKQPRFQERFEDQDTVAVTSRVHHWKPETMLNFGFLRFKVPKDDAANFERDAQRQLDMVTENELGTVLYGFIRRARAASGLLPKPLDANVEYLSVSAYVDAEARKLHGEIEHRGEKDLAGSHFTFDGDWAWGTAYRSHLAAPLETESYPNTQIVAATSKLAEWPRSQYPG